MRFFFKTKSNTNAQHLTFEFCCARPDPRDSRNTTALFAYEATMWLRYAAALERHTPRLVGHCARAGARPFLLVERVVELWRVAERAPALWNAGRLAFAMS